MRVEPVLEHREFYYNAFLQLFPFTGLSVASGLQRIVQVFQVFQVFQVLLLCSNLQYIFAKK